MMSDVVERILAFNHGREGRTVQLKYDRMRQGDIFTFFRGTCHLFYEDWPGDTTFNNAPATWICGDLHLQNYGSYKASNRHVYFDMNDFDEGLLAPCTLELARLVTSIIVCGVALKMSKADALTLAKACLDTYTVALSNGYIRAVERDIVSGMVRELLETVQTRKPKKFLDSRTNRTTTQRTLRLDGEHTLSITKSQRRKVSEWMESWRDSQPNPDFYRLLDVAWRIAGVGSLGVERYVLLVEGDGSPDGNILLDLKAQAGSALQPYVKLKQPMWNNPAERVAAIQARMQAVTPALLTTVTIAECAFTLKELQPTADGIDVKQWDRKPRRLERAVRTMGDILAWNQARSSGRQGSAMTDDLIRFGQDASWREPLLHYAQQYAAQVSADYRAFCAAYDKKAFVVKKQ
jgi:uncharacterized protein (DUF2252 family)